MHNTELKNVGNDHVTGDDSGVTGTITTMTNGDIGGGLTNGIVGVSSRHIRESGTVQLNGSSSSGPMNECAGCRKKIVDRYLLKALDMYWHEDCLKCGCCDCRLGEVGSTLYFKANLMLCKRDYLRLFGNTGYCAACSKVIPAFEMVMRARNNVYHLECFACQQCNHRFCVGDKFYLCENKILCEYDYEERMVFANMAYSPGNIALLRRQSGVQDKQQHERSNEQFQFAVTKNTSPQPFFNGASWRGSGSPKDGHIVGERRKPAPTFSPSPTNGITQNANHHFLQVNPAREERRASVSPLLQGPRSPKNRASNFQELQPSIPHSVSKYSNSGNASSSHSAPSQPPMDYQEYGSPDSGIVEEA